MYENITPESIEQEIFDAIKAKQNPRLDVREGSFVHDMSAAMAVELYKVYTGLRAAIPMFYVDETSGEYIDKQAERYGMMRKQGTKAQAELTLAGTAGTQAPAGTIFTTADGLQFATDADAIISNGQAAVLATAKEVGEKYNVEASKITQQYVSLPGITAVTNAAATGGTNPESNASLLGRLNMHRQKPRASGNKYHYEQWALEVDGVGAAHIFPAANGGGTVKVLIAGPDRQPVDNAVVAACAANIEKNRPVCVGVTVESAQALAVDVSAAVRIESSTTPQQVQEKFSASLREYLRAIAFARYEIPYNRIAYMLLDVDGVTDYTSLTVNGGSENVIIGENQVPMLGTVVVA